MPQRVLEGVKVLDLSQGIAGSYCVKLLADFGAEVIKVEPPTGDPARRTGPFPADIPHPEKSALFLHLNTGKKGVTLNLGCQTGRMILKRLAAQVDVLVENFEPRVASSLGLSYEALAAVNPGLILTSISTFGDWGPYHNYKGGNLVSYALSGHLYINGDPEREPVSPAGNLPAYVGGLHGFVGTLVALHAREKVGRGQHVEIALTECMAALHQFTVTRYTYAGVIQKRVGNRYPFAHPITIYRCQGGYVAVSASTEEQTERLLLLLGMPHLREDPRFQTGIHRLAHAQEFDELVTPWFLTRSKWEIFAACQELRIPCAPVSTVADLLVDDQYRARAFWTEVDHPAVGRLTYPGAPFRMEETPWQTGRAPLLGEHNVEVYGRYLGYQPRELVQLRGAGVI